MQAIHAPSHGVKFLDTKAQLVSNQHLVNLGCNVSNMKKYIKLLQL